MKCINCGVEVDNDSKFCTNCGKEMVAPTAVQNTPAVVNGKPPKKGSNVGLIIVLVIVGILVVGGIGFAVVLQPFTLE